MYKKLNKAEWYFSKEDKTLGPITGQQIKDKVKKRQMNGQNKFWRTGQGNWKPLAEIEELSELFTEEELNQPLPEAPKATPKELKESNGISVEEMLITNVKATRSPYKINTVKAKTTRKPTNRWKALKTLTNNTLIMKLAKFTGTAVCAVSLAYYFKILG